MKKSSMPHRYRVSTRHTAEYRAVPERQGVPELIASLQNYVDDWTILDASGQSEAALGAAEAFGMLALILAATPAISALEGEMKISAINRFILPDGPDGTPAEAAMVAEAIRFEREHWSLAAPVKPVH